MKPIPGPLVPATTPLRAGGTLLLAASLVGACQSPQEYVAEADAHTYEILAQASQSVLGQSKTFDIVRPLDTLRNRLKTAEATVVIDLKSALDVAAENSRDYQTQKETLYQAGLALTQAQYDFALRFGDAASAATDGEDNTTAQVTFRNALSTSVNTPAGTSIVLSFATTFFRSVIGRDSLDGTSILNLTLTQPLLRGFGSRIVREPLNQAERNVVYAVRTFERARSGIAVRIVQDYYNILSLQDNLRNVQTNYESLVRDRIRMAAVVEANRNRAEDLDQAKQRELIAENGVLATTVRLDGALDQFKISLGLETDAKVALDPEEFTRLGNVVLESDQLVDANLVAFALKERLDYRNRRDAEADAARRILIAEDTLRSTLDFSSALSVPTEGSSRPFNIDWDKVSWSAGFDLDLALDRLPQRNAYRRALITYAAAQRATEQLADEVKRDVRNTLRTLRTLAKAYQIDQAAVALADRRVKRTEAFMLAGGRNQTQMRDVLEAKDDLLAAQQSQTRSLVNFAVAKLQLLRDIEALPLAPKGLRYDPGLELPKDALEPPADEGTPDRGETPK